MRDIRDRLRRAWDDMLAEVEEHDADVTGHTGTDLDDLRAQAAGLWDELMITASLEEQLSASLGENAEAVRQAFVMGVVVGFKAGEGGDDAG